MMFILKKKEKRKRIRFSLKVKLVHNGGLRGSECAAKALLSSPFGGKVRKVMCLLYLFEIPSALMVICFREHRTPSILADLIF